MKDSYVLRAEMDLEGASDTGGDWLVIRRRKATDPVEQVIDAVDAVEDVTAPEPTPEVDVTPDPVEKSAPPKTRLAIMRRALADLNTDTASAVEVEPVEACADDAPELAMVDHDDLEIAETAPSVAPVTDVVPAEALPVQPTGADDVDAAWLTEADQDMVAEDDVYDVDEDMPDEGTAEEDVIAEAEYVEQVEPEAMQPEEAAFDEPAYDAPHAEPDNRLPPFELGVEHALPAAVEPQTTQYSPEDVWEILPRVSLGARVDGKPARRGAPSLIEFFRADPIAKGFDLLRTRLVRTIRAYGWRKIAIVAPTSGCGATFTAVNLALSLSRVPGSRTILMDMNQRKPGVAAALDARQPNRLDDFLLGETDVEEYLVRPGKTLAVGLADAPNPLAAEMLHDPLTAQVLDDMIDTLNPDLVLYDMPPMLAHDDLAAFLPQVDGVLLVADGTQTLPEHISACERILEGQTQLLGVVLNRGRSDGNTDVMV